jgi:hypothetical protein
MIILLLLQAQAAMEEMRMRIPSVNMAYYINIRTIEAIYRALDMPLPKTITSRTMNGYSGEEEETKCSSYMASTRFENNMLT